MLPSLHLRTWLLLIDGITVRGIPRESLSKSNNTVNY